MTTIMLGLLTLQTLLGALDNVFHHEITERLPSKPSARRELALLLLFAGRQGQPVPRQEIAAGRFPEGRRFGPRMIAFDAEAVHRWIQEQRDSRPRMSEAPPAAAATMRRPQAESA
jgi:hypothetical protein